MTAELIFTICFFAILLGIAVSVVFWSFKNGISPMPSSQKQTAAILSLLPEDFEGKIIELGSGWGTLAISLAMRFPKSTIIGYETSWVPFFSSLFLQKFGGLQNLQFQRKNFFDVSLINAGAVVCYLYPKAMRQLHAKLQSELAPGTMVISNGFGVHEWKPERIVPLEDLYHTSIYMYRIS